MDYRDVRYIVECDSFVVNGVTIQGSTLTPYERDGLLRESRKINKSLIKEVIVDDSGVL